MEGGYFTRGPDAVYSLTLIYYIKYGTLAEFPEGFEKALIAAVWLFIYPAGSQSWDGGGHGLKRLWRIVKNTWILSTRITGGGASWSEIQYRWE